MDELKSLILSSAARVEAKIDDAKSTLENKFINLADKVNEDVSAIKSSVIEFHGKINEELNEIKLQVKTCNERLDNSDDDIHRLQRIQDLRLVGFAATHSENVYDIFKKIAAAIGFIIDSNTAMPNIERIMNYNKVTKLGTPSPNILIHFAILRQKQHFYRLYLSKMPLDPTQFGLPAENRIVIGENLTKKNSQIFKQSQVYKKSKAIAQAFTEDGLVRIKFAKGKTTPTFTVRSIIELESIVIKHQHETTTTSTIPTPSQVPSAQITNTSSNSANTNQITLNAAASQASTVTNPSASSMGASVVIESIVNTDTNAHEMDVT